MYEVLAGNRVRKMPEMDKPKQEDFVNYAYYRREDKTYHSLLIKQPIYPISGSHNWKEGQLIEEHKDFQLWSRCSKGDECLCSDLQSTRCSNVGWVAEPIPSSVTNEEDELWVELVTEIDRFNDSELLYKYLKQSFTISRKPSSSSVHS